MTLAEEYKLSAYAEIAAITENSSKKIFIVIDETANKLYIKKVLPGTDHFNFYVRLTSLRHKNLIKIHDVICCDESICVFEEYINGQTLQELLENEGTQPENKATDYIRQLCDALIYLHSQNPPIIHRDIKPENIMLTTDGVIKLVDFDISREFKHSAKRDTIFMGTKEYAAPEQYGYKQTDGRTDIYAIGALLHELLTGELPQNNITYKGALKKIIMKCLRLEPKQRYQSVSALKKALIGTNVIWYKKMGITTLSAILATLAIIMLFSKFFIYPEQPDPFSSQTVLGKKSDDFYEAEDNGTVTLTSDDGIFSVQIPSDWKEDNTINDAAYLQASKARTATYFVMLADYKDDYNYSFEAWKEYVFDVFDDVENMQVSDEVRITINGMPAIQQTLSGVFDGVKCKSLLTYIDGPNYYVQIFCDSTESAYESNLSSFETIIYSITGL